MVASEAPGKSLLFKYAATSSAVLGNDVSTTWEDEHKSGMAYVRLREARENRVTSSSQLPKWKCDQFLVYGRRTGDTDRSQTGCWRYFPLE